MKTSKVTIHTLRQMKARGEKIAMLCVGGALALAGGALTARFARRFA